MQRFDRSALESTLGRLTFRLLLRRVLRAVAAALMAAALAKLFGHGGTTAVLVAALAAILVLAISHIRGTRQRPSIESLLEHLNRRFPEFEESAQLLASEGTDDSTVRKIQRHRVELAWTSSRIEENTWLPPLRAGGPIVVALLATVLLLLAGPIGRLLEGNSLGIAIPSDASSDSAPPRVTAAEITVTPAAYTGLPAYKSTELDLEVAEGSRVEWSLAFDQPGNYLLEMSDQPTKPFDQESAGTFRAEVVVNRTALYRILHRDPDSESQLVAVHSLRAVIDRAPTVRFIQPETTELDIPADEPGRFDSVIQVSDDHGVSSVEIRASVASGAGEGVKFRDQVFAFDGPTGDVLDRSYARSWDLEQLEMAPGDELYFFVVALDNRMPEPNRGRSDTIIVRWLEEGTADLAAEGLAIDVMPDYFKSQRQIIIETEQLIADQARMEPASFDSTSRALGQDQSSLKQRYGQYLGDETEGFGPSPAAASEDAEGDHDEHGQEEPGHEGHAHETGGGGSEGGAVGSAEELIAQFLHDHGATEIGPITQRNPVGLMKRALSNMWQAELHLLLSEPGKALPFEYEALKYLNLARQAERIYTQRLGFEPPPVTEERRLTGDLDEVTGYQRLHDGNSAQSDVRLFATAFSTLSRDPAHGDHESGLLEKARDRLLQMAQDRPVLIDQAALLERWQAGSRNDREFCPECREELLATFWSLVREPRAPPEHGQRASSIGDPMMQEFGRLRSEAAAIAREDLP